MVSFQTFRFFSQYPFKWNSGRQAVAATLRETAAAEHQGGIGKIPAYRQPVPVVPAEPFIRTPIAGKEEKAMAIDADDGKSGVFRIFSDNIIENFLIPHPAPTCFQVDPAAAGATVPAGSREQNLASRETQQKILDGTCEGKCIQTFECGV
jgi:hypothetical protein